MRLALLFFGKAQALRRPNKEPEFLIGFFLARGSILYGRDALDENGKRLFIIGFCCQ